MIREMAAFVAAARDGVTVTLTHAGGATATFTLDTGEARGPVDGVFGQALAAHAEAVRRREGGA